MVLDGVAIPLIRSIEAQKIQPTDDTIRKLERELDIELFYTPEEELQHQDKEQDKGTTLGDIVKITFLDHAENSDKPMDFIAIGEVTRITKDAYVLHFWKYANDIDRAVDNNKENENCFAIVRRCIKSIRKLK